MKVAATQSPSRRKSVSPYCLKIPDAQSYKEMVVNIRSLFLVLVVIMPVCVVFARPHRVRAANALPDTIAGMVFLDTNGNGRLDPGEQPMADVRVTDGVNFATTGKDGSYSIRLGEDPTTPQKGSRTVSICWPNGTWPTGRWWARLDQIADAAKVNFGLRPNEQKLPFAFMHVSDDHSAGATYPKIGPAATKLKPMLRLCINTGDCGQSSFESDAPMATLARNASNFVVPVMSVPGNHDIVGGHGKHRLDQHPLAGNGAYTKHLGPVRWSFDYAGVRFVGLDWMDPFIAEDINGNVPQVAADWFEKDLDTVKPDTRIFVFVHFPTGVQKFYALIAKHKVSHMFGGHNHRHRYYNIAGIPAVTAINFMAGGNLVIVEEDDFTTAEFCLGYKGPDHHSKRCSLAHLRRELLGSLRERETAPRSLSPQKLSGTAKALEVAEAKGLRIAMEIEPGSATRVGLRIGTQPKSTEIVWTGNQMQVAGVPFPFGWETYDKKTLLWNVVIDQGRIEFYANKRYHMGKAWKVDGVGPVTFFAEAGQATVKTAEVWGLKDK